MEDDQVPSPQVSIGSAPKTAMLLCDACEKLVSETAEACPACGHKFDSDAIDRMRIKTAQRKEQEARQRDNQGLQAFGCLLVCCLLIVSCIALTADTPRTPESIKSTAPHPYESEDDYVRRRALQYMTPEEYEAAKKQNDRVRGMGVSDAEQQKYIDAELRRRNQLD